MVTCRNHLIVYHSESEKDAVNAWHHYFESINAAVRKIGNMQSFEELIPVSQKDAIFVAATGKDLFLFIQDAETGKISRECQFEKVSDMTLRSVKEIANRLNESKKLQRIINKKELENLAGKEIAKTKMIEAGFLHREDDRNKYQGWGINKSLKLY